VLDAASISTGVGTNTSTRVDLERLQ